MSAASRWSERAHRWRARDKRRLRRIAALPLLAVFVALLTLGGGSPPDAAAQTSRTITMSIDGAGPPAGFTYPTMAEGLAGARQLRFTLDSPAPAGGIDTGTPGTAQNGNTQVIGTLIAEGDTSIAYRIHPSDDSVDKPNYAYVQIYPNTPPGGAFTVVPADRTVLLTVVDNDPTVVTLTRTDTGGGTLDEGGTARFEVSLSRPLVGAGDHGPAEVIAVPLRIDQPLPRSPRRIGLSRWTQTRPIPGYPWVCPWSVAGRRSRTRSSPSAARARRLPSWRSPPNSMTSIRNQTRRSPLAWRQTPSSMGRSGPPPTWAAAPTRIRPAHPHRLPVSV